MTETINFYSPLKITPTLLESLQDDSLQEQWPLPMNLKGHVTFCGWILLTYLRLRNIYDCKLVDTFPGEGILLADSRTLGNNYPYLEKLMLICARGGNEFSASAHMHVVQNPQQHKKYKETIWKPYYISHWPQPGLIPRDRKRGSLIKNVAFIGVKQELDEQLQSARWHQALADLGCNWSPRFNIEEWNDFTEIDLIVAARSFNKNPYNNKPLGKLINAWKSGVPAILAPESSFMHFRKSELDFLIIRSFEDAVSAVQKLKNDPNLYLEMVENGFKRFDEFSPEKITEQWQTFFEDVAFPAYDEWMSSSAAKKKIDYFRRYFILKSDRQLNKFKSSRKTLFARGKNG